MIPNRSRTLVCAAAVAAAAVTIFASAVEAQGKGNTWYSLRHTFKQGETLRYSIRANATDMTTISGAPGGQQTVPGNMQLSTGLRMDVQDVDPMGTATVKLTMDEIVINSQQMGQSSEVRIGPRGVQVSMGGQLMFDSSQMGAVPAGAFDIFARGVTVPLTRHLHPPGAAQEVGVVEQLLLPRTLVRPGDRWAFDPSALGINGLQELPGVTVQSTFEGITLFQGKQCAKIVTVLDVDASKLPLGDLGGLQIDTGKSRLQGSQTAYLDTERGSFLRVNGDISLAFSGSGLPMMMGVPMGPGGAQSTVSMESTMKMTFEIALKQ